LLGLTVPKGLQLSDWRARKLSKGQQAYAAIDAVVSRRLWEHAVPELAACGLQKAYALQRGAILPVVDIERRGMRLDTAAHAALIHEWSCELAEGRRAYVEITGKEPPKTDEETRQWLASVLSADELTNWKKTPGGKLSVDADELARLQHLPETEAIIETRIREYLLRGFGVKLAERISSATGRLHCSFWIMGAKTGRFSSRDPNLQNLPSRKAPKFRECIVAERDNRLVRADYSQIEIRAAAHRYQDAELTRQLAAGRDIHREVASLITGIPYDEIPDTERAKAKAIAFGSGLYGQSPEGLVATAFAQFRITMGLDEARAAQEVFHRAYPELHLRQQHHYQYCRNRGYVTTAAGRVIRPDFHWERVTKQDAYNWPIQGDAADCMLLALKFVYWVLRKAQIRGGLILTVHDELVAEVHRDDASLTIEIMQREMLRAFEQSFPNAPSSGVVEINHGRTWAEAAKKKEK
jgi:DNA polymerase I